MSLFPASHSLWAFSTFIVGETPFPEFSAIVMLDDIQLWYYDSNVQNIIHRRHGSGNAYEEQEYGKNIFTDQYHSMKRRALLSSQKLNKTNGEYQTALFDLMNTVQTFNESNRVIQHKDLLISGLLSSQKTMALLNSLLFMSDFVVLNSFCVGLVQDGHAQYFD